ncbi:MAG: class I SAM-dependent methyltransferase [Candidatus Lambdaproteobacteria bacterium]|nr:class I SAM-dependent methyltransferase [Candidatus Lambdaproteobacteria bacterium]
MTTETVRPEDYRQWRATTLGTITEALEQALVFRLAGPLAGLRVLDVGCGDGAYALAAARQGAQVVGVDVSPSMIEAARRRAAQAGLPVEFQQADTTALPFEDGRFNVVLAVTVLCFIPGAAAALREMARALAPGGRLVLGDLGRWNAWAAWRRVRGWSGSPVWRAATFRSAGELKRLVAETGLAAERTAGAVFYPPLAGVARLMAPLDPRLGSITTLGAAFIAVAAVRRPVRPEPTTNSGGRA